MLYGSNTDTSWVDRVDFGLCQFEHQNFGLFWIELILCLDYFEFGIQVILGYGYLDFKLFEFNLVYNDF